MGFGAMCFLMCFIEMLVLQARFLTAVWPPHSGERVAYRLMERELLSTLMSRGISGLITLVDSV